jgi:hypothetical protein
LAAAKGLFEEEIHPRIRGIDCGDAAASDEPRSAKAEQDLWTRYLRDGDATRSKATARVVPLGSQPTRARLADGLVLCEKLASATGLDTRYPEDFEHSSFAPGSAATSLLKLRFSSPTIFDS